MALFFAAFAVENGDRQSLVWAMVLASLTALLWSRYRQLATIGIAVMAALTLLFLGWATYENPGNFIIRFTSQGMTAALAALSLPVLASSFGVLVGRDPARWPAYFLLTGSLAFLAALVPIFIGYSCACRAPDLSLVADDLSYYRGDTLTPRPETDLRIGAGEVLVQLTNRDLFWHTFTIDGIGVDLVMPALGSGGGTIQIPPGTYQFFCRVPGNRWAGMSGTLIAEG